MKVHHLFMITMFLIPACSKGNQLSQTSPRPKLTVVIVVDQMRADHLTRFAGVYRGGFKRFWDNGAIFDNAHHEHAYTVTAAGHAAISTGTFPSHNGIVGNDWYDREEGGKVYCSRDRKTVLLGYPGYDAEEGRSPGRMKRPALGDWLKEQSPESKVFSVSRKDRSAIMMGGLKADGVYWYNDNDGNMITSDYYLKAYPDWVRAFNESRVVDSYFAAGWARFSQNEDVYFLAREDDFTGEGGKRRTFPYNFDATNGQPGADYYNDLEDTPFVDALILDFARHLVEKENLGIDAAPDILFIGCSAADAIGHSFGPLSQESLDHFLRLDHYLEQFFAFLDDKIGQANYVVALCSDHGVLPLPEELARRGYESKRIPESTIREQIQTAVVNTAKELGISQPLVQGMSGYGLLINYAALEGTDISRGRLEQRLATELKKSEAIEDVFTTADLQDLQGVRDYQNLYRNSYFPGRGGDIYIRIKKYYLVRGSRGTTHGSPYEYDTHVPVAFFGPQIKTGRKSGRVRTVDIAPTLSDILQIQVPPNLDGRSLADLVVLDSSH